MFARLTPFFASRTAIHLRSFSTTATRRAIEMETVNTTARLQKLRELMRQHKVDLYSMNHPYR